MPRPFPKSPDPSGITFDQPRDAELTSGPVSEKEDLPAARSVLQAVWGYADFRPAQIPALRAILSGRDGLILMPTGGGKSITFQVPALVRGGLTLVISPLVSLMQDQVAALAGRSVPSFALCGKIEPGVGAFLIRRIEAEAAFILYLAPERVGTRLLTQIISRTRPRLLVIDEAHCISSWGHDFRPAYQKIFRLREQVLKLHGSPLQCVALTATATPRVARDICRSLRLRQPFRTMATFRRDNLSFVVKRCVDPTQEVVALLAQEAGTAIVYDTSREGTEVWAEKLRRRGIRAAAYHAGMPADERLDVQREWLRGVSRVVVATNAFGMGIDKPDVRLVIHVGISDSLEAWYQEAGRAGRDGRPALSIVFDSPDARTSRESLFGSGLRATDFRRRARFRAMVRWLDRQACRNWGVLGYFGEAAPERCGNCDQCRPNILAEWQDQRMAAMSMARS